jgi:hypothetical protein
MKQITIEDYPFWITVIVVFPIFCLALYTGLYYYNAKYQIEKKRITETPYIMPYESPRLNDNIRVTVPKENNEWKNIHGGNGLSEP